MGSGADVRAGGAYIELLLRDSKFASGLRRVQKKFADTGRDAQAFGKVMGAAGSAITGAFAVALKTFASTGATLDDMTKRTGFSAKALGELKFAAEQSGTSLSQVEKGIRGMEKMLLGAANGAAGATTALSQLGLSAAELMGQSPEEQFRILSEAVAAIEDPSTRAALAMKVFGKAGSDMLPLFSEGAEGIAALRAEAERLGIVMSDEDVAAAAKFDDVLAQLSAQLKGIFVQLGAAIAGPLTEFSDTISTAMRTVIDWIGQNDVLLQNIAGMGAAFVATGAAVYGLGTAMTFLAAHPIVAVLATIAAGAYAIANAYNEATDAVTNFDKAQKGMGQKRTYGDPGEISTMIQRYEQLAKKEKLLKKEREEAYDILHKLRMEFGNIEGHVEGGKIVKADRTRAQLQAAQGGRSSGIQGQELAQARAAISTRKAEGADAAELKQRADAIKKMEEDLARTKRLVADAKPTAAPTAAGPAGPALKSRPAPPPDTAFGGNIFNNMQGALNQAVQAATGLADASVAADLEKDRAAEMQRIDDELARERISAMQDGIAREKAFLQLEHDIRLREAGADNLLTPDFRAKLEELFKSQTGAAQRSDEIRRAAAGVAGPDRKGDIFGAFSLAALQGQAGATSPEVTELQQLRIDLKLQHREMLAAQDGGLLGD